ncbi:MAG: hypothetical protein GY795_40275 [Desulfobacterales bacterium]|nr:hypothetical protein [Desulfobacterales bacterium]
MKSENSLGWVVRPVVPEEVYTDRREFLDYFYNASLEAAHRRTMSTVYCSDSGAWEKPKFSSVL